MSSAQVKWSKWDMGKSGRAQRRSAQKYSCSPSHYVTQFFTQLKNNPSHLQTPPKTKKLRFAMQMGVPCFHRKVYFCIFKSSSACTRFFNIKGPRIIPANRLWCMFTLFWSRSGYTTRGRAEQTGENQFVFRALHTGFNSRTNIKDIRPPRKGTLIIL